MLKRWIAISLILFFVFLPCVSDAASSLAGRILLQVEENGEAWYVGPDSKYRYYMGRPSDAFALMREKGIGISNADLRKIPIALDFLSGMDTDGDKLPDELEKAISTDYLRSDTDGDAYDDFEEIKNNHNPIGTGSLSFDVAFQAKSKGKIFLQVESKGEAWYIFPGNSKRYYLGRPQDAFNLMRFLGLGISNADLNRITSLTPGFGLAEFEKKVHELVNAERTKNGLLPVRLNNEVSAVARRHSQDLADENSLFTALDSFCSFPLIHHEGLNFGIYQSERLTNSGVRYFNMSAENIALLSSAEITLTYLEGSVPESEFDRCNEWQAKWDKEFKASIDAEEDDDVKITIVKDELARRQDAFEDSRRLKVGSADWTSMEELAKSTVDGWMNSPGHRKNILEKSYDEAGMGAAYINSYVITTQVFIKRIDCGFEGADCCDWGAYTGCYEPNTCSRGVCVAG